MKLYGIQEGAHLPMMFEKATRRATYLKEHYPFKQKGAPYYWRDKESAKNGDGDSEMRAWVFTTSVVMGGAE